MFKLSSKLHQIWRERIGFVTAAPNFLLWLYCFFFRNEGGWKLSGVENRFTLFWPPAKNWGRGWENAERNDRVDTTAEPVAYIWWAATARFRRLEAR